MPLKDDTNIVFSCLGGIRSRRAMDAAHEAGFNKYVSIFLDML